MANTLKELCKYVAEPSILNLTAERFTQKTAKTGDKAKPDICARGFWISGQRLFLDVRVFDPNASRYVNQAIAECYVKNENGNNQMILTFDEESFTPLVFLLYGGIGRECRTI